MGCAQAALQHHMQAFDKHVAIAMYVSECNWSCKAYTGTLLATAMRTAAVSTLVSLADVQQGVVVDLS